MQNLFKYLKRDAMGRRGDVSWAICLGEKPVAFNASQQGEESWKVLMKCQMRC
jgi:hypothetical protein